MEQPLNKPTDAVLPYAAAIPLAWCAGLVIAEGISCGGTGVVVALFLGGLAALVPTIIAILIAALALSVWKGPFPVRAWQIVCCILALGSALLGAWLVVDNTTFHPASGCQFYV